MYIFFFVFYLCSVVIFIFFFFNDTATTEIYTLSLHDPLPILPPVAKLEFAERREIERIVCQTVAVCDGANLFEPPCGSFVLADSDSPVESNYRRWADLHQHFV